MGEPAPAPSEALACEERVAAQYAIFSSNADAVDMKNVRPLIPLQIDPPDHKKFRKLLDPIFAPRQMALIEESVVQTVNRLIDGFIDDGAVDFAQRFSVPFPSQIFLGLLGLPFDELPRFPHRQRAQHYRID